MDVLGQKMWWAEHETSNWHFKTFFFPNKQHNEMESNALQRNMSSLWISTSKTQTSSWNTKLSKPVYSHPEPLPVSTVVVVAVTDIKLTVWAQDTQRTISITQMSSIDTAVAAHNWQTIRILLIGWQGKTQGQSQRRRNPNEGGRAHRRGRGTNLKKKTCQCDTSDW